MRRTRWLCLLGVLAISGCDRALRGPSAPRESPNVVLIITDDLGVGEVGCYGQRVIRTPNVDSLAREGLRYTSAYSGSCVCAPSRCTLLTGLHTGHAAIRDNKELQPEGQQPMPADAVTIASLLRGHGYATGAIGKWGLGPPGSSGDPSRHGFDLFFGYLCQRHAHNHCPSYLYRNAERVEIPGNRDRWANAEESVTVGGAYAPDLFRDEAIAFLRQNRDRPFFLLYATPVPHAALQVPEDSIAEYRGEFDDPPYDGTKGYLARSDPRAAYAGMVTRMDRDVGDILAALAELGLERDTIVIFTSDNGPTFNGGTDSAFFGSADGRRGLKGELYEGGIRVPLIVRWPGRIAPGRVTDTPTANWDLFPTLARACGVEDGAPAKLDGVDLTPEWLGEASPASRPPLYWEYHAGGGWQAARIGSFKAVRRGGKNKPWSAAELYDLAPDPRETTDLARERPDVLADLVGVMNARAESPIAEWNFPRGGAE